ncbi:cell division protein FtsA [Candidatus Fermentibacterales bacterium]|nr:cell division protein FtsA [Candidatus Fermentibacterales bacterium]
MQTGVISGLDVGTSRVTCVTAELSEEGALIVTGVGQASTGGGLREGSVIDVKGVAGAVQAAIEEAEGVSSWSIDDVFVNVSGPHVRGIAGTGSVRIDRNEDYECREIDEEDIDRAEEAARAVSFPATSRVLDVVVREYGVDSFDRLQKPPIGLRGEQLTARVYTILADKTSVLNLEAAVGMAGRSVSGVFPSCLASAKAVLSHDELEMGVVLADIGAGTTDVAVFSNGTVCHVGVVPVGGDLISNDLRSLRIPSVQAEHLKREWAVASLTMVDPSKTVTVPKIGGRGSVSISHSIISQVVTARVVEIFEAIAGEVGRSGMGVHDLPAGLVITGGAASMPGMAEAGREVTGIPVEVGSPSVPDSVTDLVSKPAFATATGLLVLGLDYVANAGRRRRRPGISDTLKRIGDVFRRMR